MAACSADASDPGPDAAGDQDDAIGTAAQQLGSGSCHSDCDCPVDQVCSIVTGATAGTCVGNPAHGFGPQPPYPICTGTCQCQGQAAGPYCVDGTCQASVPIVPVSGSWYNPTRSGWGLAISSDQYGKSSNMYGDINVTWYTFTPDAAPIWYTATLKPTGHLYTGNLYSSQYLRASNTTSTTSHGSMTLTTTSTTAGTLSWVLDNKPGSQPVQRMAFGATGSTLPITGQWFAYTPFPASPLGEIPIDLNLFFDVQGSTVVADVGLYDTNGQPTWVYGSASTGSSGFTAPLLRVTGTNLGPNGVGTPSTSYQSVGSLTVQGVNAADSSARFALTLPASYQPQVSSTQWLSRQTN